jgi:hypothetical protein
MSVSVCSVSEDQITQPLIVIVGKFVTGRDESRSLSGKLDNRQHDYLLPVEENEKLGAFL